MATKRPDKNASPATWFEGLLTSLFITGVLLALAIAAGFLLLQPVYRGGLPLGDARERRAALRGFVFTPFQARGFFADLTPSQGRRMDVTLYEGSAQGGVPLFTTRVGSRDARFSVRREIRAFGTQWSVEWHSTVDFERAPVAQARTWLLRRGWLQAGTVSIRDAPAAALVAQAREQRGPSSRR